MPTPLSIEQEIVVFLTRRNLNAATFCAIVGPIISTTKLSQAINDFRELDRNQALAAKKAMAAMDRLIELCEPLPISLRNPQVIRKLLAAMENNTLKIDVSIRSEDWQQTEKVLDDQQ